MKPSLSWCACWLWAAFTGAAVGGGAGCGGGSGSAGPDVADTTVAQDVGADVVHEPEVAPDTGPTPAPQVDTLCPPTLPEGMLFCLSFGRLEGQQGQTDLGDFGVEVGGNIEVVEGRRGPALHFDGQSAWAFVDGFSFEGDALTVEAWVRPEGTQAPWATVVDYWDGDGFWLGGSQDPGGWEVWDSIYHSDDPDGLVEGEWQHLAAVLDPDQGTLRLYVNGVEVAWRTGAAPIQIPDLPGLFIGSRGDESDYFRGTIDEIEVWSEARDPSEICADAGGTWDGENCQFDEPTAQAVDPCAQEDCFGHGTCATQGGHLVCLCNEGYEPIPGELGCQLGSGPCAGVGDAAQSWAQYAESLLDADIVDAARTFATNWQSGNPAWDPLAEGWTVVGILGIFHDAQEIMCLGFLEAAAQSTDNPVALANAANCLMSWGYSEDAASFIQCSLSYAPQDAATEAAEAYRQYALEQNPQAALEHYDNAVQLDPSNPEWAYQAMRLATELGDMEAAAHYLDLLPPPSPSMPTGWRGAAPPEDPQQTGQFCCPCDGSTYDDVQACIANCSVSLGCFVGICEYSGQCFSKDDLAFPFAFGFKFCIPPTGVQICVIADTSGNIGFEVGASLFEGFVGVGVGATYNVISGHVNLVGDIGTSNLPINTGVSMTYDTSSGQFSAGVGVSNESGMYSAQATLLSF